MGRINAVFTMTRPKTESYIPIVFARRKYGMMRVTVGNINRAIIPKSKKRPPLILNLEKP